MFKLLLDSQKAPYYFSTKVLYVYAYSETLTKFKHLRFQENVCKGDNIFFHFN